MKNVKCTPNLRFPHFKDDWGNYQLGKLLEFKNGINASKEQYGRGYKFINVLDILNNDFITHEKIIGSVEVDESIAEKFSVSYGDILFQRSSETREEVGSANVYLDNTKKATFGGFVIRGKKIGEYNPIFLNLFLKTDYARNQITSKSGGSTRYNIGQEILSSISLLLPSLEEQSRIATFFTALDKKIAELKQKKTLLMQYKKGIMRKIFSQELRFKDDKGNELPKWEKIKLGNLTTVVIGGTPSTIKKEYWNGDIGWLTSGDLNNGDIEKPSKLITELGLKNSSAKLMPPDTVLLAMTGATLGRIGYLKINCSGNQSIAGFLPHNKYVSKFLFYSLQFNLNLILSNSAGAAQPGINKNSIENLEFLFPTISEQESISIFISAIDAKINGTENQIQQTQQYKKGLLQKMFI